MLLLAKLYETARITADEAHIKEIDAYEANLDA